jgi:hypothetical protein
MVAPHVVRADREGRKEMSDEPLYIDGKLVTEKNAWRFVIARRPAAAATRRKSTGWQRRSYVDVDDRTPGAPPWCHASANTAGEAWLLVARAMVKHDAKVAEDKRRLAAVVAELKAAARSASVNLTAAALRYAAERIRQSDVGYGTERTLFADALIEMASGTLKEES